MENAKRDQNYVTTLMGVDMTTGILPTKVYVDESTHRLLVSAIVTGGSPSGTEYTEGNTDASFNGFVIMGEKPGDTAFPLQINASGELIVAATATIAKDTLPVSAITEAVSVAIVDGSGNQITSFGGGTQYTEDAVSAGDPVGNATILVRKDTPGAIVTTDGDNVAQRGTNYGAAYTQIVTSGGAFVDTFGGGTQYTEGDVDATITGTASLMEVAGNTLQPIQGTVADGLLVNLGTNNDVTVTGSVSITGTPAVTLVSTTITGSVAVTNAGITTIAGAVSGTEMQVDVLTMPTVAVTGTFWQATQPISGTVAFSNTTIAVTNVGTFATQIDGAALTALQLLDDTVATLGTTTYTEAATKGNIIGAVRRDANTTLVDTTNEVAPLQVNATGELKVAQIQALPAGTNNIGDVDVLTVNGVAPAFGTGLRGATVQRVTIATDDLVPITGAVTNTVLSVVGGGAEATAQRVTIANDSTGVLSVDDNGASLSVDWNGTQPVTGSGTATGALRVEIANNGTGVIGSVGTVTTVTGVTTVSTVTNLSQLGGVAIAMGTGSRSAGTQRVTIATDDVVPASQSGTWTVQPGNTANTTPWLTTQTPKATGGLTTYHLVSAGTTNATNIKASAGQVFGWFVYNSNASARKLIFHNTAGTPTAGASVFFSIVIPPSSGANVEFTNGIAFSTGIAITTTTGLADTDSAAVALNDLIINVFYA